MTRAITLTAAAVVLLTAACTAVHGEDVKARQDSGRAAARAAASPPVVLPEAIRALPEDVTAPEPARPVFGITPPDRARDAVGQAASVVGCQPTWVQFFASVGDGVSADAIGKGPGVPLLSLEPWRSKGGPVQRDWSLASTIAGRHDVQYRQVARQVRIYQMPMMIRFAHEMNGRWYPWGQVGGNTPAQYVAAWRHVVALFRAEGASNALWVWSPNILRGTDGIPIRRFWPGASWVDLVGVTGYGVREAGPDVTYGPTMRQLAALAPGKPVALTEVGVQPHRSKAAWIRKFGLWLAAHPNVAGFVWSTGRNGTADWRYDDTADSLVAFKTALRTGHVWCTTGN